MTPQQRSLRARLAAQTRWSQEDPGPATARAREGFNRRFLDQVDPDRILPEAERNRRVESARKAYYTRLALASAKARAARAGGAS